MTDCESTLASLLPSAEYPSGASDTVDALSSFTTTSESSPPYSSDHHSPTDLRTETPTSDQHYSANNSYSPDNVETSFGGSERDESPDNMSTSSTAIHDSLIDAKSMVLPSDEELQRQILRLQQDFKESLAEKTRNVNIMNALNQTLLSNTLASMPKVPVNLNAGIPMNSSPCPTPVAEATPPKRKRQRRNPVWPYFDVIDGTARCKQCLYSTKSVFSTNLKVHLRSHHRADYEKVIQAEDALNLNALLLSGNTSKLLNPDSNRKRMPPMTSSILMTINKLANQQQNGEENPLNNVLRQTLAATGLQQHFQQVQSQLQAQQQQQQQQQQHQAQQVQQKQMPQFALNAANLAALNQLARNHIANQQHPISPEQLMNHLNFQNLNKPVDVMSAPHGTDANGVPQPKRRRLRRHPVWMFFRDLEDRMVGCINCEFRTGSAFSTNLKMHLKAHHKEDYERVLQLEEEMRIEEGCLGPANKIKSELIDFIRHGGNASTPSTPTGGPTTPKASPLVQQIISQTMGARVQPGLAKKECSDEDVFSGMSMSDKLAALVGLVPPAGSVEGEIRDVKPIVKEEAPVLPVRASSESNNVINPLQTTFEEMRRAAERFMATSMGLAPPPQQTTIVDLNGSILSSESKSTCSAPSDASEDRKSERDKALARLWADSEELVSNDNFREFVHSLAPDYEIPEIEHLAQLAEQF